MNLAKIMVQQLSRNSIIERPNQVILHHYNKTKDWALVQTAALVINKGVQVRLV